MPQHRAVEAHELQHEHARAQRGEEQGAERRGHADGARIAVGSAVAAARGRQLERAAQHGARRRAHLQRARLHADRAAAQQRKAAAAQYPDRKASRDATARAQLVDDAFGGQGRGQAQQTIQPHGQRAEDRQRQQQPGKTGRKALREPRGQSEHDGRGGARCARNEDERRAPREPPEGRTAVARRSLPPIVACIHARLASRHAPNACTSAPWYGAVVWKDGRGGRRLPHRRAPLAAALPARRGGSGSASSPEKHASASGACFRSEDALSGASDAGVSALPRGASAGRRPSPTARRRRRTARWGSPNRSRGP